MKLEETKEILRLHSLWAIGSRDGRRANLGGADLRGIGLIGIDLRGTDIRGADLRGTSLVGANLSRADLRLADLSRADLRGANLRRANLSGANLSGANFSGAYLEGVVGVRVAACHWSGHGERGRQLLAVELPEGIMFYCGCFRGSESDLRKYISERSPEYKVSRRKALNFLRSCF
jgi:hypothetical protein